MPMSLLDEVVIEKTPLYFVEPNVAKRIFQMNERIKLILTVREPVTRAESHYLNTAAIGRLPKIWNGTHMVDTPINDTLNVTDPKKYLSTCDNFQYQICLKIEPPF